MESELRLCFENTHFWRDGKKVLRDISCQVRVGEHWAILGPNGSGKTTLMKIAVGYEPSSLGRVFLVEGWLSRISLPEVRTKVGFVSSALIDHLVRWSPDATGLEIVLSGKYAVVGAVRNAPTPEKERARDLLRRFGMGRLEEIPFRILSTGERQVCLVARSYMSESELVILDEPCAGLDLAAREIVLGALDTACRERPHVPQVLITHHPEEIVPSITHVLLLKEGEVVAQGPKEEVLNQSNLSATYGISLGVVRKDGRVWAIPSEVLPQTVRPFSKCPDMHTPRPEGRV